MKEGMSEDEAEANVDGRVGKWLKEKFLDRLDECDHPPSTHVLLKGMG